MLKFIRKYQLFILVVGGSLLMVVFLLQPVLTRLSPDPRKSTVAKLADGTTFNGFDYQRASFDLAVLKRVYSRVFAPFEQGGLGLDQGAEENTELHWLLLSKQANDAGLVGDAGEGRTWLPILAQREAGALIQQQMQEGLITSQEQAIQAMSEMTLQIENGLARNVALATGMLRGMTEDDVYRTLAYARGIQRLYGVFSSMPAFSDIGAIHAAKDRYDTIAVDAVLIKGELFADSIPEPTDDQLQAFFDLYKGDSPSDNDFSIGYTQPARVKLGWLTLNKQVIESSIVIDRIELNKLWRTDHQLPEDQRKYPGDFAGERLNIENEYRANRALDIMVEADKILRSQVLQATRGLSKDGDLFILPEDWDTNRPTLEGLAQSVVTGLRDQLGINAPLPTIDIRTDRWLNSFDISSLQGFGASAFRVGSRQLPAYSIPQVFDSEEAQALVTIQPRVPMVDPASEDLEGNRYYAIIYDLNEAGPADSIDDVGREKVLADYRTVKGYELLASNLEGMRTAAQSTGDLAPAITAALALGDGNITRPGVARNLLVGTQGIARGRLASSVEPGLNTPAFRDAVTQAAAGLDQLTPPDTVAQSPILIAVELPSAKGVGLAKVIAPRPMTQEDYAGNLNRILNTESNSQIRDAMLESNASPFSLSSISDRYGYERVKKRKGDEEADDTGSEAEESEATPAEDPDA